jgi:HSP20 family protein
MEMTMNPLTRNTLNRYEPLSGRLEGLFDDFFRPALVRETSSEPRPIRVDVRETPEAYTVQAELAGVRKDDIAVEIEGNEVSISAEARRENAPADGEKWLRSERFHGKAGRRFALPQELDEARAVAKFADGVLELTLPKKAAVTGRKVEIN